MARYTIEDYTHGKIIRTARTLINARKVAIETFRKDKHGTIGVIYIYDNGVLIEDVVRNARYPAAVAPLQVRKYYVGSKTIAGEWTLKKDGNLLRGL